MSIGANGANIYWQPHVQAGAGYDTNVRLAYDVPGQKIDRSALFQTQVDGELGIDNGAMKSTVFGRYWYQSVPSNSDYDADIAQIRWNYLNSTERSSLTFNVDVQFDTTLTSEFENSGFSPSEKKDRRYFRNKLAYRWSLTERDYLESEVSADAVKYLDAENTGLSDYDARSLTASYGHQISEVTSAGVQLTYSEFDIQERRPVEPGHQSAYETDNVMAVLFSEFSVTEQDNISLQAGFRTSNFYDEYSFDGIGSFRIKEEGNGSVFSANYRRTFDTASLRLSASRDLRPNGTGFVIEQDSIGLDTQYHLSERFSFSLGASVNRQREPVKTTSLGVVRTATSDREFAQVFAGLRYAATEQHALALEFNERWQQYETEDKIEAESTALYLRWYWTPPQKSL